jgi:hypothetical protein
LGIWGLDWDEIRVRDGVSGLVEGEQDDGTNGGENDGKK